MSSTTPLASIELANGWAAAQFDAGPDFDGKLPDTSGADWFEAEVPGALQYDLMRLGRLKNPYASSKAVQDAEWVHQTDWLYTRTFAMDAATAGIGDLFLEVGGIDTFADIWLNGERIGTAANAYRSYRFLLPSNLLKAEDNELLVHVKAHKRMVAHMVPEAERRLGSTFKYKSLIRRYQRSFFAGSSLLNLGGEVLGIGLYKPMRLIVLPRQRIEQFHFKTLSVSAAQAKAEVELCLNAAVDGGQVRAALIDPDSGDIAAEAILPANDRTITASLEVKNPRLWWPRGYGRPDRYRLELSVIDSGKTVCTGGQMVGLRTSRIVQEQPNGRPTFEVHVNGVKIHCRGYNTIPVDYIKVHPDAEANRRLLEMVTDSHSNMLRIWGGGGIESADYYETCDALGIMIWQDFYIHSTTYPDYDEAWVAEYRTECEELLGWLRNHPSLVVVCGGNELYEGWDEWGWRGQIDRFYGEKLFTEVGKEVAESMTPELPYVLNSPHGGGSCQAPKTGEVHNWGNFYNSTKDALMVTETCWSQESYSKADTLEKVMHLDLDEYADIGWPEKWQALTGRGLVTRLPYSGGPLVMGSLRDYLKCLEIEQAVADHHALTNLLMRSPSMNGLLYWPLNKGGPLFQFGAVDYLGYPLASYYVVKRLFNDVVVTIYRDMDDIRVIGANRGLAPFSGKLVVGHHRLDGEVARSWEQAVEIPAGETVRLTTIEGWYQQIIDRNAEVMKASLISGGEAVSEETLFFTPLMEFETRPGSVSVKSTRLSGDTWKLDIEASAAVKLFYVDGNQKFLMSDNYFAIVPGQPRSIEVKMIERASDAAPALVTACMDSDETYTLVLD